MNRTKRMNRTASTGWLGLVGMCALTLACGDGAKHGLGVDFDGGDGTGTGSGSGGSGSGAGSGGSGSGTNQGGSGNQGNGGNQGTGGATGRGGSGTGGAGAGTGGASGTGGAVGTGGTLGTGGAMGRGGATGTGGGTSDGSAGGGADAPSPQVIARDCRAGLACTLGPTCAIPLPQGLCFEGGRQVGQQHCVCNNNLYFCACVPTDAGVPTQQQGACPANPMGMACSNPLGCFIRADAGAIVGGCQCRGGVYTNCQQQQGPAADCPAGAAMNMMPCTVDGQRCSYRTEAGQGGGCRCVQSGGGNALTWRCGG